jgi:hypothetical protein
MCNKKRSAISQQRIVIYYYFKSTIIKQCCFVRLFPAKPPWRSNDSSIPTIYDLKRIHQVMQRVRRLPMPPATTEGRLCVQFLARRSRSRARARLSERRWTTGNRLTLLTPERLQRGQDRAGAVTAGELGRGECGGWLEYIYRHKQEFASLYC